MEQAKKLIRRKIADAGVFIETLAYFIIIKHETSFLASGKSLLLMCGFLDVNAIILEFL